MKKLIFFLLLLCPFVVRAQSAISGTITDSTGTIWINSQISIVFMPTPGTPGQFSYNGNPSFPKQYSASADVNGVFSVALPENTNISPARSQWIFTICPSATFACTSFNYTVQGNADISSLITSNLTPTNVSAAPIPITYGTNNVKQPPLNQGGFVFDAITKSPKYWDGTSWNSFTSGSGTPGGLAKALQFNNNGAFAGSAATVDTSGNFLTPATIGVNAYNFNSLIYPQTTDCFTGTEIGYTGIDLGHICNASIYNVTIPGYSHGNDPVSGPASGWSTAIMSNKLFNKSSAGIGQADGGTAICSGVGDCNRYYYMHPYGGVVSESDEAAQGIATNNTENIVQITGTVPSGVAPNAILVHTTCIEDCNHPGVGRYLTEPTGIRGYVTNLNAPASPEPNTLTLNITVPVSTAWGTTNSLVQVPNPIQPSDRSTWAHPTVSLTLLNGTVAPGDLACFAGNYQQSSRVLSVSTATGGQQTFVLPMRDSEAAGSWVMFNGLCGYGIDFDANTPISGVSDTIPFIGSTDGHTAKIVAQYTSSANNINLGLVDIQQSKIFTISRTGNTVSIYFDFNNPGNYPVYNQPSVSIAGTANFNGVCTNTVVTSIGINCTQTGTTTSESPTNAYLTVGDTGYGNTRFSLVRAAQVVDVRDLRQPNQCTLINVPSGHPTCDPDGAMAQLNGTFALEDNIFQWTAGELVTEAHHYATTMSGIHTQVYSVNPLAAVYGIDVNAQGYYQGQNGTSGALITNTTPLNTISGNGGTAETLDGIRFRGEWRNLLTADYAPENKHAASFIPCPATGLSVTNGGIADCTQPQYTYYLWELQRQGGFTRVEYNPSTGNIDFPDPAHMTSNFGSLRFCMSDGTNCVGAVGQNSGQITLGGDGTGAFTLPGVYHSSPFPVCSDSTTSPASARVPTACWVTSVVNTVTIHVAGNPNGSANYSVISSN